MPLISSGVMDKYRPVFSMIVIMIINVGLDLSKIGQDLLEAPLVVAASGPALKVIGNPTVEGRGVDGTRSANNLTSGDGHRRSLGGGCSDELPVVFAAQEGDGMP
jgi:hypothetical protein